MLNLILEEVQKMKQQYGENIYKSADENDIKKLEAWIVSNYSELILTKINEYINFIKTADEFEFNGLTIYSSNIEDFNHGFIGANEIWHDVREKKYIFFADNSMDLFCYDTENNMFYQMDQVSDDIIDEFSSFDEMIKAAIEDYL